MMHCYRVCRYIDHHLTTCLRTFAIVWLGLGSMAEAGPQIASPNHNHSALLQQWTTPFTAKSATTTVDYQWQQHTSRQQRICALIPASDTSYWFAVNYGLVKKAKALGVSLKVFNLSARDSVQQQQSIADRCLGLHPQGIIISSQLQPSFYQSLQKHQIPLVSVGKNLQKQTITASSSPAYSQVGQQLSTYMNHQPAEASTQTVLFPGEQTASYVGLFVTNLLANIDPQKYQVKETIYSNNHYLDIKSQLNDYLNSHLETKVIVASALVAEAAVEVLDEMSLADDVQIISYELSAQVYRGIKRGYIQASATNLPVIQGFLAIDLALKAMAEPTKQQHISPQTTLIDVDNISHFDIMPVFAPYGYRETLEVN